ncbi:MAG: helix-turn-helix transcriptional regulator [Thermodesulfobacteriota bacterium]
MARGDTLGRQWRIIQLLISARRGWSAADLASELDCNARTVYRDLEALQVAGFPLYTERVEGKNLWSVLDTVKHQVPVPFSLTELMALYFGRDMLRVFQGTAFHDSLESLFQKVRTTLPPESVKYLNSVEQTLHVGIKPYKDYARFKEMIQRVEEAAREHRTLEIVYYTMSRKSEGRRRVDPFRIWFYNGTFYLIGHCHKRGEVRIFALDRIRMLSVTKATFEIPEDFDLEAFLRPSLGVFQGEPVRVIVRFAPRVAGYIWEKVWHESQEITLEDDGSVLFEAEVAGLDEIRFWVLGWGSAAEVLEPEALREAVRAEARALAERYEGVREEKSRDAGK